MFNDFSNSACVLSETFHGIKIFWSIVEIWPVKVGPYTHFLAKLIGNFGQKPRYSHSEILSFLFSVTLGVPFLAKLSDFIDYRKIIKDFLMIFIFWAGTRPLMWKNGNFGEILQLFLHFFTLRALSRPKKLKSWKIPYNVCIIYKIRQLGKEWDFKSDIEQK